MSDQNGTQRVWTISANGGNPQPLEETNAANTNKRLAWWPSSDIVYQKPGIRNYVRINGNAQTTVIQQDESVGWVPMKPAFSPDGKRVAFLWNRQPKLNLWIISLEPYSESLDQAGVIYPFGWSPDGKYVYVVREGREIIWVPSAPPNEISSVAALPGNIVHDDSASVSPDGRQIIVSVAAEASDVWLMENLSHRLAKGKTVTEDVRKRNSLSPHGKTPTPTSCAWRIVILQATGHVTMLHATAVCYSFQRQS